ncbi:MAG TPA: hypothetical protein VJO72_02960, partial [Candidatus Dormibacteraeota bacterium]|nr:hypothetical protein [Candidatus Dormibacteraeota bacterium]
MHTIRSDRREQRLFLAHNLLTGAGAVLAGVFGFAMQAFISHRLRPAEYGAAFSIITLVILLTLPASAFSRLVAWRTSHELATPYGNQRSSDALLQSANRRLFLAGVALAVILAAASPLIGAFIHVPSLYVLCAAPAVPFQLATPMLLGALQGEQRFHSWSGLLAGFAAAKFAAAGGLAVVMGARGVLIGITLASAATYLAARWLIRRRLRPSTADPLWRGSLAQLGLMGSASLAIAFLMSSDIVLVKHYFSAQTAGAFVAVAAISRAIYWGMGGITGALFPKVAARHARGEPTWKLIGGSLGLAALGGTASLAVFSLAGHWILLAFAGRQYVSGSGYLGWYALGMGLLGAAAVLINAQQSLGRMSLLGVLLPGALLKPVL